jgi:alpha-1,6-mannosyltransferase
LGSVIIGIIFLIKGVLSKPLLYIFNSFFQNKENSLILIRFLIGLLFTYANSKFREAIKLEYNSVISNIYGILSLCQFHLIFYMSRPLSNTFSMILVIYAYYLWLNKETIKSFFLLGFASVVFRSEILILILPFSIISVIEKRISIIKGSLVGIFSIFFGIGIYHFKISILYIVRFIFLEKNYLS